MKERCMTEAMDNWASKAIDQWASEGAMDQWTSEGAMDVTCVGSMSKWRRDGCYNVLDQWASKAIDQWASEGAIDQWTSEGAMDQWANEGATDVTCVWSVCINLSMHVVLVHLCISPMLSTW